MKIREAAGYSAPRFGFVGATFKVTRVLAWFSRIDFALPYRQPVLAEC
jgi:hypothetical protein